MEAKAVYNITYCGDVGARTSRCALASDELCLHPYRIPHTILKNKALTDDPVARVPTCVGAYRPLEALGRPVKSRQRLVVVRSPRPKALTVVPVPSRQVVSSSYRYRTRYCLRIKQGMFAVALSIDLPPWPAEWIGRSPNDDLI